MTNREALREVSRSLNWSIETDDSLAATYLREAVLELAKIVETLVDREGIGDHESA